MSTHALGSDNGTLSTSVKKALKARMRERAKLHGMSVNQFLKALVCLELGEYPLYEENAAGARLPVFLAACRWSGPEGQYNSEVSGARHTWREWLRGR